MVDLRLNSKGFRNVEIDECSEGLEIVIITSKRLIEICTCIMEASGVPEDEAEIVANVLVEANLRGQDGHGVLMLPGYLNRAKEGRIKFGVKIETIKDTPSMSLVNGNWGFGQVIAVRAMEIAIRKAKKNDVGYVGVFNCNHIGMLAYYSMMALEHDMIGMILCNSGLEVTPYGGRMRKLGTNPLSIAIPADKELPYVLDMATSIVAAGKVRAKVTKGEVLPEGWVINEMGLPTTDPEIFRSRRGMLLPFGGYKAYGLSLMIDLLGGALTGAGCGSTDSTGGNGTLISVINIASFTPVETFKKRVDALIKSMKSTSTAPGFDEILIPGEPEFRAKEERSRYGIEIPDKTWQALKSLGKEVGLNIT